MATVAQHALERGLSVLLEHHPQVFSFGGVAFDALVSSPGEAANQAPPRGLDFGPEYDLALTVDPTATAFDGGLPRPGEFVSRAGIDYPVIESRQSPGSHRARILVHIPR